MRGYSLDMTLAGFTTPHLVDACLRISSPLRVAPAGILPVTPGMRCEGPALPVRHGGSVDVFLKAMNDATPGSVLTVDNQGRHDEGCIGDLIALEAKNAGFSGIVIWGRHRDTADLRAIELPLFSFGPVPAGPTRIDSTAGAVRLGDLVVTSADYVAADDDGVILLESSRLTEIVQAATEIRDREQAMAKRMREGTDFRTQVDFPSYLVAKAQNPDYGFREHLRKVGGAIEE